LHGVDTAAVVAETVALLRERVDIESAASVSDGAGGQTITWSAEHSSVPAMVRPVKGREGESLGRETSIQTYLVTVRHGYTVTTRHRLLWGSTYLNIRSVENRDLRNRFLTMECEVGFGT